uniref:Protein SON n=1 Tax=Meloidogyne incognita TaxID=6306 RepID=A0A914LY96_MELIC
MKVKPNKKRPAPTIQDDQSIEKSIEKEEKKKKKHDLSSILQKAPPVFPWLFSNENVKNAEENAKTEPEKLVEPSVSVVPEKPIIGDKSEDTKPPPPPPPPLQKNKQFTIKLQQNWTNLNSPSKAVQDSSKSSKPETLFQRASDASLKKAIEENGDSSFSPLFHDTSNSILSLIEGSTQMGLVTEAHREAAVSEWRAKTENKNKERSLNKEKFEEDEDLDYDDELIDVDEGLARQILADVDKEELEARARKKAKKAAKRLRREKLRQSQNNLHETKHKKSHKTAKEAKSKSHKKKKSKSESSKTTSHSKRTKKHDADTDRKKSRKSSRSSSRTSSRHHQKTSVYRKSRRSRSSSRTYSSPSSYRRSRSRSFTPLPQFDRRKAFETRKRLIEESWHRRIQHSVRACEREISPIREHRSSRRCSFSKADYMDKHGLIDKQKLLEIATKNATRLAMEGKLPKGAELVKSMTNKSVNQLIAICKQLQNEENLLPRGRSSSEDEDRRYMKRYDEYRERRDRSKDREFSNRAVRPAPDRRKVEAEQRKEAVKREENKLRLTFPVSSGVKHRVATNVPTNEGTAGPLVRYGEIGPLTTALAKVRTNIPSAYLAIQEASTSLNTQLPPENVQKIEEKPLASSFVNHPPPPDIVSPSAYKIALEAAERLKKDKTKEPILATCSEFIGPVIPIEQKPAIPLIDPSNLKTELKPELVDVPAVSSWDKPGHLIAREAFLKKIGTLQENPTENVKSQIDTTNNHVNRNINEPQPCMSDVESVIQSCVTNIADEQQEVDATTSSKTNLTSSASDEKFVAPNTVKPSTKNVNLSIPSKIQVSLPSTSKITKQEDADIKEDNPSQAELMDRVQAYVESQVARQKAESVLHATILSAQLSQATFLKSETPAYFSTVSQSRDPIGATKVAKSVSELISERLRYTQRLQRDPNDYDARKKLKDVDDQDGFALPGEFTGHTGARVLSEKELEPSDPRFHAWAKKIYWLFKLLIQLCCWKNWPPFPLKFYATFFF